MNKALIAAIIVLVLAIGIGILVLANPWQDNLNPDDPPAAQGITGQWKAETVIMYTTGQMETIGADTWTFMSPSTVTYTGQDVSSLTYVLYLSLESNAGCSGMANIDMKGVREGYAIWLDGVRIGGKAPQTVGSTDIGVTPDKMKKFVDFGVSEQAQIPIDGAFHEVGRVVHMISTTDEAPIIVTADNYDWSFQLGGYVRADLANCNEPDWTLENGYVNLSIPNSALQYVNGIYIVPK